jgi:hypothetical protein
MSGRYLGVVSCVLPIIREIGDEWKVSRYSQLCAKVSRCSQLCATTTENSLVIGSTADYT